MNPLPLARHHEEIDGACEALRSSAFTDDPRDVADRYRSLERAVLEHMQVEEDLLLPSYARHAPADAAAIRATHDELRRQLYQLGIDTELHAIRLEAIDRLVATLREHAAHEDRAMYPWAKQVTPPATMRELIDRVAQSLRVLGLYDAPRPPRPPPPGPVSE